MPTNTKKTMEIKQKPFDFVLFITVLVLLAMGIVMVLSASSPSALAESRKELYLCYKASKFWSIRNCINDYYF